MRMAVDIETYDPNLVKKGPGVYRKDGYILGVAISTDEGFSEYFDFGHPGCTAETRARNKGRVTELLSGKEEKATANGLYDLDWLVNGEGIPVNGLIHDVQYTEALLDEYADSFALDTLAGKYCGLHKEKDGIGEYAAAHGWKGDARQHLYKMPYGLVAPYARTDTTLLFPIWDKQIKEIQAQDLTHIYTVERKLLPLLTEVRRNGIRVNEKRRLEVLAILNERLEKIEKDLFDQVGHVNFNSSQQLAAVLDRMGVIVPITEPKLDKKTGKISGGGNPSVTNDFLESLAHTLPFAHHLVEYRKVMKCRDTFIEGAFKDFVTPDGRIHCQLNPVAMDDGGTVSGRFSCKNPNMQQVPSKNGNEDAGDLPLGDLCRSIFEGDEGCDILGIDYAQIEYRFIMNYAAGPSAKQLNDKYRSLLGAGYPADRAEDLARKWAKAVSDAADAVRAEFKKNPYTDYHSLVAKMTGLPRKEAKSVTFGVAFFMGKNKMMKKYGWDEDKASHVLGDYFGRLPFILTTRDFVVDVAKERGYIKTIGGRRARVGKRMKELHKEYAMFNRLPQGGAADLIKTAMVNAYEAGIFNTLPLHLQVHDELVMSTKRGSKECEEAARELKHIMETAYTLKIPIIAEAEIGPDWGHTYPVFQEEKEAILAKLKEEEDA